MLTYPEFSEKVLTISRYLIIVAAISAPISTAVCSIACVGILLTWLISGQAFSTLKISYQHRVGKAIFVFYAWLIIGTFYADTSLQLKINTLLSWQKLIFVFILLGLFYQPHWQRRFVYSYLAFMHLASLVALLFWLTNIPIFEQPAGIIMTNYVSQSMAFIVALLCCLFLSNKTENAKYKFYLWACCLVFMVNILAISPARSGYLALPPAVIFAGICIYGTKKLPQLLAILTGILLMAGLGSSNLQQRIKLGLQEQTTYQSSNNETSIGLRMVFYQNTLDLIKESPSFGYGTSSFQTVYSQYVATKYSDWRGGKTSDPHNQYLFVLLENGGIGLLIFVAYIYFALSEGWRHPLYGQIAASILIAFCVSSLFNSHFKTFPEGNLLAFFLGALLAQAPKAAGVPAEEYA